MTLLSFTALAQSEPYAVLSDDGQTVTFYYDDQKTRRGGIDILDNYPYGNPTTAVFDASFANYRPESTAFWFMHCSSLTTIKNIWNLNTSEVTDMRYMFYGCYGLTSLDVSGFDTSNVKDMSYMFYDCFGLTSLDMSGLNTSSVMYMQYMFWCCSGLTSLDVSGFDTSNVTDMRYIFYGCSGLTSLDVGGFDTSNVTDMCQMFGGCSGLTSLDLSDFNTSNVTRMDWMFAGCTGLTSLDVSGFNTSNVTRMDWMFSDCSGLTSLDLSSFNTSNVIAMDWMFAYCSCLLSLDLSGFNTSNVTSMGVVFANCSSLTSLDLGGFDTSNVTYMSSMFYGCSSLTSLDLGGFDTSNVKAMDWLFGNCSGLTSIYTDEAKWSTESVTESDGMFSSCLSLVGGNGTLYDENHIDAEYARIDKPGQPGYFTAKQPEMEPVEQGETINIGDEIDENTNLDGNVVDNVYFNINDGSYDATGGCIVVNSPTDDSFINGQDIFGDDFKEGYNGIVFMVPAGEGTINVEAETTGDMVLKVKIGNKKPITMVLNGKLTISFPYDVTEDTYVYIYGGTNSAGAKGMKKASGSGSLKIYGIEVVGGENGIEAIDNGQLTIDNSPMYNLNGQRVISSPSGRPGGVPTKGVFIRNGKKVLVK